MDRYRDLSHFLVTKLDLGKHFCQDSMSICLCLSACSPSALSTTTKTYKGNEGCYSLYDTCDLYFFLLSAQWVHMCARYAKFSESICILLTFVL